MLPRDSRMRRPEEFRLALRTGRRASGSLLSASMACPGFPGGGSGVTAEPSREGVRSGDLAKVGFVVSRAVGSAVVRNRVQRRLREIVRGRMASLPEGCLLVVRAHPAAAGARQADLAADLDLVIERLLRRQVGALRR
ncbi:MAG: ribonuclease P protein component [Trebonia sp.]